MADRKKPPQDVQLKVLIEAGYRCAVPTCRNILAIDIHHIVEVAKGGRNEPSNLIALCPMCHALYHRGTYSKEAIYAWKSILVALGVAFDRDAIDLLLFLTKPAAKDLVVDGNGVLRFARLIAADLVTFKLGTKVKTGPLFTYQVWLTQKGDALISAWSSGNRDAAKKTLSGTG